jgi:hypothetical protein
LKNIRKSREKAEKSRENKKTRKFWKIKKVQKKNREFRKIPGKSRFLCTLTHSKKNTVSVTIGNCFRFPSHSETFLERFRAFENPK